MKNKDIEKLNRAASETVSYEEMEETVNRMLDTIAQYEHRSERKAQSEMYADPDLETETEELPEEEENQKKKYSLALKIQLAAAVLFTVAVIITIPVIAWFSYQKEMAVSTRVNSPATLEIKAGGHSGEEQSIINFELSDIDTEDRSYESYVEGEGESAVRYYYKDFVFCVKGKAINSYDLQLVHTTNIAFKYEIFRAVQDDNGTILYTSKNNEVNQLYKLARVLLDSNDNPVIVNNQVVYEDYSDPIDGHYVNNANAGIGGRLIAKDNGSSAVAKDLTARSYDGGEHYQAYANPVYWVKRDIPVYTEEKGDDGFTHSYVLRISWVMKGENDDVGNLEVVQNNKETDVIYITASADN